MLGSLRSGAERVPQPKKVGPVASANKRFFPRNFLRSRRLARPVGALVHLLTGLRIVSLRFEIEIIDYNYPFNSFDSSIVIDYRLVTMLIPRQSLAGFTGTEATKGRGAGIFSLDLGSAK